MATTHSFGTPAERAHYGRITRSLGFGSTFDLAHYGRLVNTTVFVDGAAGGKVWIAETAGTIWDALDNEPSVWTADCEGGIRWIADKCS